MAGEWEETTLGECAQWLSGGTPFKGNKAFWSGPIPWVSAKDMKSFRLHDAEDHISPLAVGNGAKLVPAGTILLLVRGMTLHNDVPICMVTREMAFNQDIKALRPSKNVDGAFLAYWLLANKPDLLASVDHAGHGTGRLVTDTLKEMPVQLPPLAEQKAIASVLGALDDKIELNRRMNETLEAMARALFQSWFVDFEPVRAKLDGRQPVGLDPGTAALFPEHLEDSPLGHIPKGWEVRTIESLCDVITSGGTPARMHMAYWEPGTIPWFKTGELLDGPLIDAEEKISKEGLTNSSCKLWPAGTILFALYASPTVGRFGVLTKPSTANQAAAALIAKPIYGVPFLMGLLYEARAELQRVAVGAAQQNINQGVLKSHAIIAPPPALAKDYSVKVTPWFDQRIKLAEQSQTLATLRNTLIPKLLSGELKAEEFTA
jgi:type I restriction enzyme S subunit